MEQDSNEGEALLDELRFFNEAAVGHAYNKRPISLIARLDDVAVGYASGHSLWDWFYLHRLIVAPAARGRGIGKLLLESLEGGAASFGCIGVYLDTFSFQAPIFYIKNGYSVAGQIDNFPAGSSKILLTKHLSTESGTQCL